MRTHTYTSQSDDIKIKERRPICQGLEASHDLEEIEGQIFACLYGTIEYALYISHRIIYPSVRTML